MIRKLFNDFIFWVKGTTFDPESSRYIMWDDTVSFIILLLAIIYPYMAFFSSDNDSGTVIFHSVIISLKKSLLPELNVKCVV